MADPLAKAKQLLTAKAARYRQRHCGRALGLDVVTDPAVSATVQRPIRGPHFLNAPTLRTGVGQLCTRLRFKTRPPRRRKIARRPGWMKIPRAPKGRTAWVRNFSFLQIDGLSWSMWLPGAVRSLAGQGPDRTVTSAHSAAKLKEKVGGEGGLQSLELRGAATAWGVTQRIFPPAVILRGNQTTEKASKSSHFGEISKMKKSNATSKPRNKSKRGGARPGAGRKPGTRNRPANDHLYGPCCDALASAMDGAMPFEFICAMWALGAPLEASRAALDLTKEAFAEKYGRAIAAFTERQRLGAAAQERVSQ